MRIYTLDWIVSIDSVVGFTFSAVEASAFLNRELDNVLFM
jgi:hypothetical protein